jgi:hypothetical protein
MKCQDWVPATLFIHELRIVDPAGRLALRAQVIFGGARAAAESCPP